MAPPAPGGSQDEQAVDELRRLCEEVCAEVMRITGSDGCLVFLPSEDRSRLDKVLGFPLPGEEHAVLLDKLVGMPAEAFEVSRRAREGHTTVLHRRGDAEEPALRMLDVLGIATLAHVPAPLVGGWRCGVSVAHLRHHDYGIEELEAVQALLGCHTSAIHAAKLASEDRG